MSDVNDSGINIEWRLENFNCDEYYTYYEFKWPSLENSFRIFIVFDNKDTKLVIYSDHDLILYGKISVVNADKSLHLLRQINKLCVGKRNKLGKELDLKLLKEISHPNKNFAPNETISLFIQIWSSSEEKINVYYKMWSRYFNRQCCFKWTLNVDVTETGIPLKVKYIRRIPEEITEFYEDACRITYHVTLTAITEKFSKSNCFSSSSADMNYLTIETDHPININLRLETMNHNGSGSHLVLLNSGFIRIPSSKKLQLDVEVLQKINSNSQIYYPNGCITLLCFIDIEKYPGPLGNIEKIDFISENTSTSSLIGSSRKHFTQLCEKKHLNESLNTSMYKLFEESQLCDIKLRVNKDTISCHKTVLCARSPVFMAMFQNDMQEKQNRVVDIVDIAMSTLTTFIKALYTDILEDVTWQDALKLYVVADKYDVVAVKTQCCDILLNYLAVQNVCELLDFFEDYQEEDINTELQNFFLKHAKEIINLKEWEDFLIKRSLFAARLIQNAFSRLS